MTISHAQVSQAAKMNVTLEEHADGENVLVRAFWPDKGVAVYGTSPTDAIKQMKAAISITGMEGEYRVLADMEQKRMIRVYGPDSAFSDLMTPVAALKAVKKGDLKLKSDDESSDTTADPEVSDHTDVDAVERASNGVALDGATAYAEGTPAGDNPWPTDGTDEEYESAVKWDEEWDAAADKVVEDGDDDAPKGGSVVGEKYRAKYSEAGHPTHCGDWLAETLNELCIGANRTDIARFEAICSANGVDTSKYRREGTGWQGRIRMTGRNLLAKKVYMAGGLLLAPSADPDDSEGMAKHQAPAEWMSAQRFKMPKAQQDQPIPEAK